MLKAIRAITLCAGFIGLAQYGHPQVAHQDGIWSSLPAETTETVQALIDKTIAEQGVAGHSIGLMQDGELVFKTHGGFANIEHQVPITPDSRYQIYSASKLFFNVALMQLIERGELDPDAPLRRYLPDLTDSWAALTFRQTWSHMTGTTDILDLNGMEPTAEEALQSVIDIPLTFTPGTQTAYNQTNFLLLKNVFERITGTGYQDYLEEEILAPIGIDAIPFGDLSLVAPNLTTNYEKHGFEDGKLGRRSIKFPPYVYTSAGITLDEFATWWQAVLSEQYVKRNTLEEFWEPVVRDDGSASYRSNGWERLHENGMLRIGHGGGARIHLFHYIPDATPEKSATVIFLNNGGANYFDHRNFGDALADTLIRGW